MSATEAALYNPWILTISVGGGSITYNTVQLRTLMLFMRKLKLKAKL